MDDHSNIDNLIREVETKAYVYESQRRSLQLLRTHFEHEGNSDEVQDVLDRCVDEDHRMIMVGTLMLLDCFVSRLGTRFNQGPLQVIDAFTRELENGRS